MFKKALGTDKCFPGAMPKDIGDIKNYDPKDWYFSNKLDGERRILFNLNGKTELINRKCARQVSPFEIPIGCIYDIELMEDKKMFMLDYLDRDILDIKDRLLKGREIIKKHKLPIRSKVFKPPTKNNLKALKEEQKKLGIKELEGYIFIKRHTPVQIGTTDKIFKWKVFNLCTIDFLFSNGGLFVNSPKGLKKMATYRGSKKLEQSSIVEMYPVVSNGKLSWEFLRYRTDKDKPNYISVYNSNLNTIENYRGINDFLK